MEQERRYGQWAGDNKGKPENKENCIKAVFANGSYINSQCKRKRGFGPNGLYCKQHAKKIEGTPPIQP